VKNKADELKDWEFKIDEVSANVYKVRGVDKRGRSVERIGTNLEILLSECKDDALKITTTI
jgi:hypothetical protein